MSEKRAKQIRRASKRTASAPVGIVHIRAGYDAATPSINRSTVSHAVQDAVKDLTPAVLKELRKNSRYLDCNSAVYSGAVKRMTTLIVGTGIMATSSSKDVEWGNAATARYSEWGKSCDITGTSDMPALQQIIVRSMIVDGEIFALKTGDESGPRIQLIEAHQIADIVCNDVGRPLYYVPVGVDKGTGDGVPDGCYPAENVIHFFRQFRAGQRRGVPLFTPAINTARDVDELVSLEKAASKAAAKTVEIVKRKGGVAPRGVVARPASSTASTDTDARYREIVGPEGLVLDTDEEYEQVASQRPSPAWQGFIDFLLGVFCLAGDMPPSAFLQIKVGGADTRRDLASAQRVIEQWQQVVANKLRGFWEYYHENDKTPKPVDWQAVAHQFPRKLTVDDGRQNASDRADLACGAMTISEFAAMYGADGAEHIRELREEMHSVNPRLTPEQIDDLITKRLFGVEAPASAAAPAATSEGKDDTGSAGDVAASTGSVQATALNGAQVDALKELAMAVASGELPQGSAKAIARAAFPLVPEATISAIFDGITPTKQPAAVAA